MTHVTKMFFRSMALTLVIGGGIAAAETPPKSSEQQQPAAKVTQVKKLSSAATVQDIDRTNRRLMLKDSEGKEFTVAVSKDVKRFDAIKKGDRIAVDYYEAIGISLQPSEPGAEPSAKETTKVERTPGKLPGGEMARKLTATAEVTKIDRATNMVTIKRPTGELDTIHVTDPDMQQALKTLKEGDLIEVSYQEAVAISVERPSKAG